MNELNLTSFDLGFNRGVQVHSLSVTRQLPTSNLVPFPATRARKPVRTSFSMIPVLNT
jgi:hypothetical protein